MTAALRTRSIIAEHAVMPLDLVTDDRPLGELSLDSLDRYEIAGALEEEFGGLIDDRTARRWTTVGDVVRHVEAMTAPAPDWAGPSTAVLL